MNQDQNLSTEHMLSTPLRTDYIEAGQGEWRNIPVIIRQAVLQLFRLQEAQNTRVDLIQGKVGKKTDRNRVEKEMAKRVQKCEYEAKISTLESQIEGLTLKQVSSDNSRI